MNLPINPFMGRACFFTNSSYNCPSLSLYGYSTELALHRAIKRKLKSTVNPLLFQPVVKTHNETATDGLTFDGEASF
ncbi:MAG: hypothetical protein V4563_14265 [Pseudomonadota bacterium]